MIENLTSLLQKRSSNSLFLRIYKVTKNEDTYTLNMSYLINVTHTIFVRAHVVLKDHSNPTWVLDPSASLKINVNIYTSTLYLLLFHPYLWELSSSPPPKKKVSSSFREEMTELETLTAKTILFNLWFRGLFVNILLSNQS